MPYPKEHSSMPLLLMNDWQILLIHPHHKGTREIKAELVLYLLLVNSFKDKIGQTALLAIVSTTISSFYLNI